MAALALRVLAAALLEGVDLRPARLLDDLADHACASDPRRADVVVAPSNSASTSSNTILAPASPGSVMTVIVSSAATLYCLPPVLMTANIVLSRVPPGSLRMEHARPAFWQLTENAALANRGVLLGLSPGAQNQKRGFAAALEQDEPIGGASIKVNRLCDRLAGRRSSRGAGSCSGERGIGGEDMFVDWLLASFHHLAVFSLAAILSAEILTARADRRPDGVEGRPHDAWFGMLAALVVAAGFCGCSSAPRATSIIRSTSSLGPDGAVRRGRARLCRADR